MSISCSHNEFSNAELTSFAMEVIEDLGTKSHVDPTDAFICQLADEIMQELVATNFDLPTSPDEDVCSSYTDPSAYQFQSNTSLTSADASPTITYQFQSNTRSQYSDPPPIPYATELLPQIISTCQLSTHDSFNHSLPDLPSSPTPILSSSQYTVHSNLTNASAPKYCYVHQEPSHSIRVTRFTSPLRPPPPLSPLSRAHLEPGAALEVNIMELRSQSIPSDISSCISPRGRRGTPTKVCAIPDFSEFEDIVTIRLPNTKKPKPLPRKPQKVKHEHTRVLSVQNDEKTFGHMRYSTRSRKRTLTPQNTESSMLTDNEGKPASQCSEEFNGIIHYHHLSARLSQ
eukprot:110595_1